MQVALLSGVAQLAGAGGLARGGGEAGVAPTAAAPARRECHRSGPVEVGEHVVALAHDRPHRDVQAQVRSVMTGALAATAGATVLRNEGTAFAEARERRVRRVRHHEDVTAAATVTTVRAAVGDVLLAPKADSSSPA